VTAAAAGPPPVPDVPDLPKRPEGQQLETEQKELWEELHKARYQASLDEWTTRQEKEFAVRVAREDTARAAETALVSATQAAYIEVAKGSLDRALTRMNVVTGGAAAIGTTYTALLGLIFGIGEGGQPLPSRGVAPALLFGLAVVLSAVYAAFLRERMTDRRLLTSSLGGVQAEFRLRTFLDWTFDGVLARAWALRAAIVSLGLGLAFLPLPFLKIADRTAWIAFGILVVAASIALFAIEQRLKPVSAGTFTPELPSTAPTAPALPPRTPEVPSE
jgi:hypothetical protein